MNYQTLFDLQPRITHADRGRLLPQLSGWNKVCAFLAANTATEDDLKRLVVIEFHGKKRKPIVQKILGRLQSSQRKRVIAALNQPTNEKVITQ